MGFFEIKITNIISSCRRVLTKNPFNRTSLKPHKHHHVQLNNSQSLETRTNSESSEDSFGSTTENLLVSFNPLGFRSTQHPALISTSINHLNLSLSSKKLHSIPEIDIKSFFQDGYYPKKIEILSERTFKACNQKILDPTLKDDPEFPISDYKATHSYTPVLVQFSNPANNEPISIQCYLKKPLHQNIEISTQTSQETQGYLLNDTSLTKNVFMRRVQFILQQKNERTIEEITLFSCLMKTIEMKNDKLLNKQKLKKVVAKFKHSKLKPHIILVTYGKKHRSVERLIFENLVSENIKLKQSKTDTVVTKVHCFQDFRS